MTVSKTLLLIFLFSAHSAFSQNKRVFINITNNQQLIFNTSSGLRGPQAGFGWKNNRGNLHEFELSDINYESKNNNNLNNTINAYLGLRYQYSLFIAKQKFTGKLKPFAGFGISNYNRSITIRPLMPNFYKTRNSSINFAGYIAPGLEYTSKKNLFVNLSVPIDLFSVALSRNQVFNPTWTSREQNQTEFKFDTDPLSAVYLRAGVGWLF